MQNKKTERFLTANLNNVYPKTVVKNINLFENVH